MSTFTQILYQIVFSTKNREHSLIEPSQEKLYRYIWGILRNNNCHPYRVGGVEDHIHIVTHVHQSVALSDLVKNIKLASADYFKKEKIFPNFSGWQDGYGAFTYAYKSKDNLIEYVKNQKEHHRKINFKAEYIDLLTEHGIEFDEKYLI